MLCLFQRLTVTVDWSEVKYIVLSETIVFIVHILKMVELMILSNISWNMNIYFEDYASKSKEFCNPIKHCASLYRAYFRTHIKLFKLKIAPCLFYLNYIVIHEIDKDDESLKIFRTIL